MATRITPDDASRLGIAPAKKRGRFPVASKERRTVEGIVFASLREARRFVELRQMERAGLISELICQPSFPVQIGDAHFCTYRADFSYNDTREGGLVIEDVKSTGSRKDEAFRLRRKAAELFHGITVREVIR